MPKIAKELSATEVRRLTSTGLHAVGGVPGLLLQVRGASRLWIYRYRLQGRRRSLSLGSFPAVSLAKARSLATDAMLEVKASIDPVTTRQAARAQQKLENSLRVTFREAARQYLAQKILELGNKKHAAQWESTLETYAFPVIGDRFVEEVETSDILQVLEPIWVTKTETASRLRGRIEKVLDYCIARKFRSEPNPARWKQNLEAILAKPKALKKIRHHPALSHSEIPRLLADLRTRGGPAAPALELLILTGLRSGSVRAATWSEIDLERKLWVIPAAHMKAKRDHVVPLSPAAINLLKRLPRGADAEPIFRGVNDKPISDMALTSLLRRMDAQSIASGGPGYRDPASGDIATPHGFRSSFAGWAYERTNHPREIVEAALAHSNDPLTAAYFRSSALERRAQLMAQWSAYLEPQAPGGNIVKFGGSNG